MSELVDIPITALLEELQRRFDLLFVYGLRVNLEQLEAHEEVYRVCQGDSVRLIGMIEREKFGLLHTMYEDSTETDDE